jgi:hypothetical protein
VSPKAWRSVLIYLAVVGIIAGFAIALCRAPQ